MYLALILLFQMSNYAYAQSIDLELTIAADNSEFSIYTFTTTTITVENTSTNDANGVKVYYPLPSGFLAFSGSSATQGSYSSWNGIWEIGEIASGDSKTIDITLFTLDDSGPISSLAQIYDANEEDEDSTPNNNSTSTANEDDEGSLTISPSNGNNGGGNGGNQITDIEIDLHTDYSQINVGSISTSLITITNTSQNDASNVEVKVNMPAGIEYTNHSANIGDFDTTTNIWTIETVHAGYSLTLILSGEVVLGGSITTTVEVIAQDQEDEDSTPDNDDGTQSEDDEDSLTIEGLQVDMELSVALPAGHPSVVDVGDDVTFIVSVTNVGISTGTNSKIRVILPDEMIYKSCIPGTGEYLEPYAVWFVGDIVPQSTHTFELVATVIDEGPITFLPEVRTVNQPDIDSTPSNFDLSEDDIDEITITTGTSNTFVDLSLTKVTNTQLASNGDQINYTLTVTNSGTEEATGVLVEDILPAGLLFESTSDPSYDETTGIWAVGSVDSASSKTIDITATVTIEDGTIVNFAQVNALDQVDSDSEAGNNTSSIPTEDDEDSASITVSTSTGNGEIDLQLEMNVDYNILNIYNNYVFTTTITNTGGNTATDIIVFQGVPSELANAGQSVSKGNYSSWNSLWNLGSLESGESATLELTLFSLSESDPVSLFAQVNNANELDDDSTPGNDTDNIADEDDEAKITLFPEGYSSLDDQTINFPSITDKSTLDPAFDLNATASSGLDISYTILSGPATVSGNTITLDGTVGTVTIQASQAGDSDYNPAPDVVKSFNIINTSALNQSITFDPVADKLVTDSAFDLNATASSGLDVSYTVLSGPATVSGNTITLDGTVGTVSIQASQAGDNSYNPAPDVIQNFDVTLPLGSGVDLELSISAADPNYQIYNFVTLNVDIVNAGNLAVDNVLIDIPLPTGMAFTSGTATVGAYDAWLQKWNVGSLNGGENATLELTLFALVSDPISVFIQVETASPDDIDSTPGNNSTGTPIEDDEAIVTISSSNNLVSAPSSLFGQNQLKQLDILNVYPNPPTEEVNILFKAKEDTLLNVAIYNVKGERVSQREVKVLQGFNELSLDITALASGHYSIIFNTLNDHQAIQFIKQQL